ncbi:MAG: flagellar biosynthetic protein FliO [Bacillota bacterium]
MWVALLKIIIVLPLVTALAYFLIKYGLARQQLAFGGRRRMRLVEQLSLSPKACISLVEVGGTYFLIAHSENGFNVIKEMEALPELIPQQEIEAFNYKAILESIKTTSGGNYLFGKVWPRKGKEK